MVDVVTTSLEFNILRLHDRTILGFSDKNNAECQDIFTKFEKASGNKKCRDIMFVTAELEDATEVFEEYKVDTTPVFLFFKNDAKVDELLSNDAKQLQKKIIELLK